MVKYPDCMDDIGSG